MSSLHFIGIDVSKETFDVAVHDRAATPMRFPNSSGGVAAFLKAAGAQLPEAFVVVEATGGYESALLAALYAIMSWHKHGRSSFVEKVDESPYAASFQAIGFFPQNFWMEMASPRGFEPLLPP